MPEWVYWLIWVFAGMLAIRHLLPLLFKASGVGDFLGKTVVDAQKSAIDAAVKSNPAAFTAPSGQLLNADQMVSDAESIYNAFGLQYGWWDANGWYETEEAAFVVLRKYNLTSFPKLASVYANKYKRDLKADILKYVQDGNLYNTLPNPIWQ